LWEKNDRIGGQILLASRLPFKSTLVRLLDYYEAALERANVVVRCGEIVRADQIKADVVVLASGPRWDDLDGIAREAAIPRITAADAITRLDEIKGRVLIVGAGLTGAELAWALSSRAREVILAERDDDYDDDVNLIAKMVLARELAKGGVDLLFNTEVAGISGPNARFVHDGIAREREVDVVISTIRGPGSLVISNGDHLQRIVVGENAGKRGLLEATLSGYRAASGL
jgi:2,4-dienoyl-CoA reductase (NADPH2)